MGCTFIASSITHPILWFVLYEQYLSYGWSYEFFLLLGEGYVWFVEGLWYQLCRFKNPFLLSFILRGFHSVTQSHRYQITEQGLDSFHFW